ncbi:SRPBCC family protein [Mucilaginibacter mali]|uniref:SRPBCC family protein n=1 Tax=Mucilaginibacter mali TaxID=2740462 RepID=A0A7D4QBE2_9SPHI|nr:SRPBCC family protein [Mucilaginibacter mali]QKJ32611.1 SRPBCC family protein [Mucilaginibacter mali]
MNILLIILLSLAGLIALLFLLSLLMPKKHYVKREIIINEPVQKVFDYVRFLKNQEAFNTNAMADADRKKEFRGTDGTVGYVYAWSGNKDAGEGEKEIMSIVDGKSVEMEIRFVKPMKTSARILMELEPLADDQTKLWWSNAGELGYPINMLIPMMQKHVAKDMDKSLTNLKNILEAGTF